jgi:hypothetical protein
MVYKIGEEILCMRVCRLDSKNGNARFIVVKRDGAYRVLCMRKGKNGVLELEREFRSSRVANYYLRDWYGARVRGREKDVKPRGWESWFGVVENLRTGIFPKREFVEKFPIHSR